MAFSGHSARESSRAARRRTGRLSGTRATSCSLRLSFEVKNPAGRVQRQWLDADPEKGTQSVQRIT